MCIPCSRMRTICSYIRTIIINMQDKKLYFRKVLAKVVRDYRLKSGKSISKISNEIDLTKSVWHEIELANRDPQLSTIWRIAEGLNMPLSKIIIEMEKDVAKDYFLEC